MADWTIAPDVDGADGSQDAPPTLVTRLDDGKEIARQKHSNALETWDETYKMTGAEFDTWKAFFDTKGYLTSFTKLSYDVYGTPTQERSVRFAGPWEWERSGPDYFTVKLKFRRAY